MTGPMEAARDKVTVQVATIPNRILSLQVMVGSLIDQVDKIKLMLNLYDPERALPEWMKHPKIETVFCDNSIMDGYKFLNADQNKGYVFICDDDIKYPTDFVETMLAAHRLMGHHSIISIMGKNLAPLPIESYARGGHEFFRAFEYHTRYYKVNLIGMCGGVYHSDFCKINEKDMKVPDSDVCMSAYAIRNHLPMWVIPHPADWCADLTSSFIPSETQDNTMWNHNKNEERDALITRFINQNLVPPPRGEEADSFSECANGDMACSCDKCRKMNRA